MLEERNQTRKKKIRKSKQQLHHAEKRRRRKERTPSRPAAVKTKMDLRRGLKIVHLSLSPRSRVAKTERHARRRAFGSLFGLSRNCESSFERNILTHLFTNCSTVLVLALSYTTYEASYRARLLLFIARYNARYLCVLFLRRQKLCRVEISGQTEDPSFLDQSSTYRGGCLVQRTPRL